MDKDAIFVILSNDELDDNNLPCYWSCDQGWVEDTASATRYTEAETRTVHLPLGNVVWAELAIDS